MSPDNVVQPWVIRSTLIAVGELDRSIAFYGEIGPFNVIEREDRVAVLGDLSPTSAVVILRETQSPYQTRHGQQSLGIRSMTFNVGSFDELDRIEAVLRSHDRFTDRRHVEEGASELVRGRDPDNLPLTFVCYAAETVGSEYYRAILALFYSMDA
jgi:hypothetical protein